MKLKTSLNIGDKAWGWTGKDKEPVELTVGMVRLSFIEDAKFQNNDVFMEQYMMRETGIGNGILFTWGINLHKTEEEAKKHLENYLKTKLGESNDLSTIIGTTPSPK